MHLNNSHGSKKSTSFVLTLAISLFLMLKQDNCAKYFNIWILYTTSSKVHSCGYRVFLYSDQLCNKFLNKIKKLTPQYTNWQANFLKYNTNQHALQGFCVNVWIITWWFTFLESVVFNHFHIIYQLQPKEFDCFLFLHKLCHNSPAYTL